MLINLPKEWFEKHIRDEGDYDIGAGAILKEDCKDKQCACEMPVYFVSVRGLRCGVCLQIIYREVEVNRQIKGE